MSNTNLIGETVLTSVDGYVVPALVIAVAKDGAAVFAVVHSEFATTRTWLERAPASEIEHLDEGQYIERGAAIWPAVKS